MNPDDRCKGCLRSGRVQRRLSNPISVRDRRQLGEDALASSNTEPKRDTVAGQRQPIIAAGSRLCKTANDMSKTIDA
jgi:hypothetical protein